MHDYTEGVRRLSQLVGDLSVRLGPNTTVRAAAVLAPPPPKGASAPPSSSGGSHSVDNRASKVTSTYSPSPGQGRRRERHRRRRAREEGTGTDTEPPLSETVPLDRREARSDSKPRRKASPSQEIKRKREYLDWDSSAEPHRSRTVCSQALRFQGDSRDPRAISPTALHRKTSSSSRRLFSPPPLRSAHRREEWKPSLRPRSEFSQGREIQLRESRSDTRPPLQRSRPTSPRTPQGGKGRGKEPQANEAQKKKKKKNKGLKRPLWWAAKKVNGKGRGQVNSEEAPPKETASEPEDPRAPVTISCHLPPAPSLEEKEPLLPPDQTDQPVSLDKSEAEKALTEKRNSWSDATEEASAS